MADPQAASQPPATQLASEGLRRDSLNLPRLAFIGLAYFSLAPVIYLNMGFMETDSGGPVMPFLFILITVAVLPTAVSFALLNNRRPSAGSGYTWLWESTYPVAGLWLGWVMITTYVVVSALYPVAFGTFFNALLAYFHLTATTWTGIAGGIAAILIIGYLNHNNIKLSSTVIGILMILEAAFVAAVAIVIVVRGGHLGHFSASPFNPGAATAGFSGLSLAAIFAFLSIAGVDSVAPVAEEAHTPRRLIPLATILITVTAGLFWALTSYGFAISVPVRTVAGYVNAGQITPVLPISRSYIGGWAVLVPITGFTAALASFGASLYAAGRITYAVSREGFVPSYFAGLHPRFRTPWRAEAATLLAALVFLIAVSLWQGGPESAYAYLGEIFVFFVLLLYIFVNLANIVYHARFRRESFNWFLNGITPVAGIVIDGYVLYKAFFVSEISLPFKSGSSIVWFSLAWAVIGIGWALWWARRRHLNSISLSAEV
ncbi:MAG: APC family permease [Actinobacteria bacterium]|nr:APC family permease [Actinomycetota bacterium]